MVLAPTLQSAEPVSVPLESPKPPVEVTKTVPNSYSTKNIRQSPSTTNIHQSPSASFLQSPSVTDPHQYAVTPIPTKKPAQPKHTEYSPTSTGYSGASTAYSKQSTSVLMGFRF
jgi:hypothetical protein